MGDIKLLDCTLRDGGYLNDWKFGHDNLVSIFERLVDAGVDMIEIGFLDERRPFDMDRSIMPDTDSVGKIYGRLDRKQAMVVGMIDYGTCGIEHIRPRSESFLDGIRVIFKKHLREPALRYCRELKDLGYNVFAQLVSVTSYSDEEMMDLIRLANEVRPYAVSMVDTYGLMHQNNLMHYFRLLDEHLASEIGLGYHAHNNFQMGYANCIAMLSMKTERTLVVDGTIYGMGKSAGNAPIELIAMHMNNSLGRHYHISQILEAIDSNLVQFYHPASWGYNMFYYIAASHDCHPNYVAYLMNKQTLSVKSIMAVLRKLEGEKKLLYDKNYIEELYVEYQKNEVNDENDRRRLAECLAGKEILVFGPGVTVKTQQEKIREYLRTSHPTVVAINYVPEAFAPDYIFLSNSKRYLRLATRFTQESYTVIATSNVTGTSDDAFAYTLNYSSLIDAESEIPDVSLVMLLKVLLSIGCARVHLAGFDGYSSETDNYHNMEMEYDFVKSKAAYLNRYISGFLNGIKDRMEVHFLTDTRYDVQTGRKTDA